MFRYAIASGYSLKWLTAKGTLAANAMAATKMKTALSVSLLIPLVRGHCARNGIQRFRLSAAPQLSTQTGENAAGHALSQQPLVSAFLTLHSVPVYPLPNESS